MTKITQVISYADIGQPRPTVETLCGPVAQQIHKLEQKASDLEYLLGQVLATLRVNRQRENLISSDDKQFDGMIDAWFERWEAISAGAKQPA